MRACVSVWRTGLYVVSKRVGRVGRLSWTAELHFLAPQPDPNFIVGTAAFTANARV